MFGLCFCTPSSFCSCHRYFLYNGTVLHEKTRSADNSREKHACKIVEKIVVHGFERAYDSDALSGVTDAVKNVADEVSEKAKETADSILEN